MSFGVWVCADFRGFSSGLADVDVIFVLHKCEMRMLMSIMWTTVYSLHVLYTWSSGAKADKCLSGWALQVYECLYMDVPRKT